MEEINLKCVANYVNSVDLNEIIHDYNANDDDDDNDDGDDDDDDDDEDLDDKLMVFMKVITEWY